MATDLEKLVVQLSADIKGYEREMRKAVGVSNQQARAIENRYRAMNKNLDGIGRNAARSLIAPLAGVSAALSVREVARYADAWTVAGNKVAAAAQISGMQARSLEGLNEIANETRSGISETVDLYAKLMRSTAGVAKSEMEVAKATEIVNKAFKAGGAAASEQVAGILQLSQGLGSGVLQGDELRSVRENAPILAQAIADYYQVSIAGLKKLGEEGQITSEGVFKAILAAGPKIEAAFATTNSTIQDGITRVSNAFTQYIGQSDSSLSATQRLVAGLHGLADNVENVADVTLKVAGVIAAALLGRAIGGMIAQLGLGAVAVTKFIAALRAAQTVTGLATALGGLSAAAGPLGILIGGTAAAALVIYSDAARKAEERSARITAELEALGLITPKVAAGVDGVTTSVDNLARDERIKRLKELREELERMKGGRSLMDDLTGSDSDTLAGIVEQARRAVANGAARGSGKLAGGFEGYDLEALRIIKEAGQDYEANLATLEQTQARLATIADMDVSRGAKDLAKAASEAAERLEGLTALSIAEGALDPLDEATDKLSQFMAGINEIAQAQGWSSSTVEEIETIIASLQDGGATAEETEAKLAQVGNADPAAAAYVGKLGVIVAGLQAVIDKANAARMAMQLGNTEFAPELGRFGNPYQAQEDEANTQAYIAEQKRVASLSKEQLSLEKEISSVRKDALADGVKLTDSQIKAIAEMNLAASAGGKGGGGGKGGSKAAERFDDALLKDIEGMKAETAALNALTDAQIGYGSSIERARKEAEILQDLQNKGIKITPELKAKVSELAAEWEKAAQANEDANARLERMESIGKSVADALSTAFESAFDDPKAALEDLGKQLAMLALKMQLTRMFPSVFGADGIVPLKLAGGGPVRGRGTGTSDSIPARLSNGEFVVNAGATARNRKLLEAINSGRAISLARGGYVGMPRMPSAARAGGGGANVQIIDQRPAGSPDMTTDQQTTKGPNGREMIRVIVGEQLSRGEHDKSMRGRFGARPQKVIR